jgi:SAV_6107-like HEPN
VTSKAQAQAMPVPAPALTSLARAREALDQAAAAVNAGERYARAHVAALRATAAVLTVRTRPSSRGRQRNAWALLTQVAPEFTEWAAFFAAGATKRAAAEAGLSRAVTEREADDLLRDSERFLHLVESAVGVLPGATSAGVGWSADS